MYSGLSGSAEVFIKDRLIETSADPDSPLYIAALHSTSEAPISTLETKTVCNCVYGNVARVVYSRTLPKQTRRLNKSPHTVHAIANRSKFLNVFHKSKHVYWDVGT